MSSLGTPQNFDFLLRLARESYFSGHHSLRGIVCGTLPIKYLTWLFFASALGSLLFVGISSGSSPSFEAWHSTFVFAAAVPVIVTGIWIKLSLIRHRTFLIPLLWITALSVAYRFTSSFTPLERPPRTA
jgi:hypothetical protein